MALSLKYGVFLLLLLALLQSNVKTAQAAIPEEERNVLIALYGATGGDGWTNNTGWKTGDLDADGFAMPGTECTSWYGISCSADHVTGINLFSNHLTGSIPATLGSLNSLILLALDDNQLTGSIPTELGSLSNLQTLKLSVNNLAGSIPSELGNLSSLTTLHIWGNQLTGSIPSTLGDLANLRILNLHSNKLTGEIPASLVHRDQQGQPASQLLELYLNENLLSGAIPPELGDLSQLQYLGLSSNRLQGTIPTELGQLTGLVSLGICNNYLSATDPDLRLFLDEKAPGWEGCQLSPATKSIPAVNQLLLSD